MKTIALFLHQPYCSVQSNNGIIKSLSPHYTFKIFTRHNLEDNFFDDVDCVCFPGGFGDASSFEYLTAEHQTRIKQYLEQGGKYLGICMGAYWAGSEYFNILDNVDAVQYITRPGTDTRRPHAKALPVVWNGEAHRMFFYDGCALIGNGEYQTIATYANGDAMAIIQNNVGLIGCHPESEQHWYNNYSWMNQHYHNGTHHKILLDFVNELVYK
jgi:glutamine amidotransferase-like uncharacterized protein